MACHASTFLLLLVMCDVIPSASSTYTFVSEPPLTRRYVGDDVTIEWTLSSDPERFPNTSFFNENDVRIIRRTHGGLDTIGAGYAGRVSFYNTSSRGIGFRLTDVTLGDAGRYRCRYEPVTQPPIESSSVLFIFGQPSTPVISLKRYGQITYPFTVDLVEGANVTLLCEANSTSLPPADIPAMTYTWTRNGQPIGINNPPDRHSVRRVTGRSLDISPVSRDDVTYGCSAREEESTLTSQTTRNLNVLYPPTVTMTIDPEEGSRGDRMEILCTVDSRPLSQVTRKNLTSSGIPHGTVIPGQRQHVLILDPADCLDSGIIRCTANNGVTPAASDQRELNVFCPPRLDSARQLIDRHGVRLGGNVTFLVYVIANPAPVTWTYTLTTESGSNHDNNVNGVRLSPSGNPGTLTIASVQPHHYGDYDVTVTNNKGQPLVIQLSLDKTGPPESPKEFRVRDVTCARVTLQWEAGFDGGSPQTFHLSYRRSGAAEWWTETVGDSGQDIIHHKINENIQEVTGYEFKLFAQNDEARTEDKGLTAETTACPKFVPDSPVISIEDNIATISWEFTQRVDRVEVKCCNDRCTERTVDQPTAQQPITMEVPPGNQSYIFTFRLFQDSDLVFSREIKHRPAQFVPEGKNAATIGAVTSTLILVIVVVIVVIVLRMKRRVNKREVMQLETVVYRQDTSHEATPSMVNKVAEFGESEVSYLGLLSDGAFFQLHSALVHMDQSTKTAVVKTVKDAASNTVYTRYLADHMSVLSSINHVNIVILLGCQKGSTAQYENVATVSSLSLVLGTAPGGDLHAFLTENRADAYQKTVTKETMMRMALEVATGALVLSELKPDVLHYSMRTKHVLLDGRGVCKLTGFSTAKAVRAREAQEALHKGKRPVRWMSAETLDHLEHTTKSDVWSFGVLLWELLSLGETPYAALDDAGVQVAIQEGQRLDKPNNCEPATYELMMDCWVRQAERRPDFEHIKQQLSTCASVDSPTSSCTGEPIYLEVF